MSEEIKPCPFCGSNDLSVISYGNINSGCFYVICKKCNTEGPKVTIEKNELEHILNIHDLAIQKWNQRPYDYDMPAIVKKVQRLEAAINQAITDCVPLLSWIDDDDTAVEMVEHLSEILGGALCKQPE